MVAEVAVQLGDLDPHLHPRSSASRFDSGSSNRKIFGLADDGAADGDALALAARELGLRLAVEQRLDAQDLGGAAHPRLDLGLGAPAVSRPKARFLRTVMCG